MKIVETTISETSIRMRYADSSDPLKATEWIDFQLKLSELKRPSGTKLGEPEPLHLAELRRAALQCVQDLLDNEIRRLRESSNRNL